jgi:hypothetical protein
MPIRGEKGTTVINSLPQKGEDAPANANGSHQVMATGF